MAFRQQKIGRDSHGEMKSREGRLRAAFLGICHPLKSRPNPRGPWDGAARDENPTTPWEAIQYNVRNAVSAAVATRNPHVIKEVRIRVEHFYATLQADALAPIPRDGGCVLELVQDATRESAEAQVAVQRLLSEMPSPTMPSIEEAVRQTGESQRFGARCYDFLTALMHKNQRPNLRLS
jgi:hypothetical protein